MSSSVRRGYDRGIDLLDRLVPLARVLRSALFVYALVVVASALVIAAALVVRDAPDVWFTWLGLVVLVGVLGIAPALLLVFVWMLAEVLELPGKLRALPDVGPAHATALATLVTEARRQPGDAARERPRSMPRDIWTAGRLIMKLRDAIPLPGALLAIVRVPLLIAVAIAFVAGGFEILLAGFAVLATAVLAVTG